MVNHILKLPLSFKIRSDFLSKKASIGSSNLFFEDAEEILIDVAFDHVKAYKINMDYMLLLEFKKE